MRRLTLVLTLATTVILAGGPVANASPPQTVTGTTEFRAIERLDRPPWFNPLPSTRVLVVGPDGKLMTSGLTSKEGVWKAPLTVVVDERFRPARTLGTVTAIAIAEGYVERLFFDVPVTPEGAVQVITLARIQPHRRNEPGYELGMLHRLWVLPLLDYYAGQAGLGKQRPVEGDWNAPHWSPVKRSF